MTWSAALVIGIGLGLAHYGGLWFTVRQVVCRPRARFLLGVSASLRLALVGAAVYALGREGGDALLPGLGGFWLARCLALVAWGGIRCGW